MDKYSKHDRVSVTVTLIKVTCRHWVPGTLLIGDLGTCPPLSPSKPRCFCIIGELSEQSPPRAWFGIVPSQTLSQLTVSRMETIISPGSASPAA